MSDNNRIKGFDTLKGLAVLITVTIGHYWQFTPGGYYAEGSSAAFVNFTNKITQLSFSKTYTFMELLLMISGFQMAKYYSPINKGEVSFKDYFLKRVKRLIPIAAISTIIMYIGMITYYHYFNECWFGQSLSPAYLIENIFLIQSWVNTFHTMNGPLWYISVFFFCTILFYLLSKISEEHGGKIYLVLPILIGIYLTNSGTALPLLNYDMSRGYIAFFLGVCIALISKDLSDRLLKIYIPISISAFIWLYITFDCNLAFDNVLSKVLPTLVLLYAPLLIGLSRFRILNKIIGNPALCWLGSISYELCALNFPFYIWLEIINRRCGMNLPYGKAYMYYIIALIQILLALIIHYVPGMISKILLSHRSNSK